MVPVDPREAVKVIVRDGPVIKINRYESDRAESTKKVKTKILQCTECGHETQIVSKPSVLSKALQSPCKACVTLRATQSAKEVLEARQRRLEEQERKYREREAHKAAAYDRLCKYCGVQWTSELAKRGGPHGNVCEDCRKVSNSRSRRANTYGLSIDLQEAIFKDGLVLCQNPGCGKELHEHTHDGVTKADVAVIDHCHGSKRVRGILCHTCNVALGMLGEDGSRILGLWSYLAES